MALRLLATRDHSRDELGRKLAARGFDADTVNSALDELTQAGLLDEARLAEAYVAERLRKGFGPRRIRRELRDKGLSDASIEPHLDLSAEQWLDLIATVHAKRFGDAPATDGKERGRRGRFLEYRGFPTDLIARFLNAHS